MEKILCIHFSCEIKKLKTSLTDPSYIQRVLEVHQQTQCADTVMDYRESESLGPWRSRFLFVFATRVRWWCRQTLVWEKLRPPGTRPRRFEMPVLCSCQPLLNLPYGERETHIGNMRREIDVPPAEWRTNNLFQAHEINVTKAVGEYNM